MMNMNSVGGFFLMVMLLSMRVLSCAGECEPSMNWERTEMLDETLTIKWNYTNTDVTVLVIGKTKGFVGFGFSQTKRILNNSDLVIGWIDKTGNASLQDIFIENNKSKPVLDAQQSYSIVESGKNDSFVCICFKRKLNTCDQQDFNIVNGTLQILWVTNDTVPQDNKTSALMEASSIKGPKSIYFLSITFPRPTSDIENKDFLARKTKVTVTDETLYWCTHFKVEPTKEQYYLVGFEPIIQKHADIMVHHIFFYTCPTDLFDKMYKNISEEGYNCVDPTKIHFQNPCKTIEAVWAVGGENQFFPPDFAIPHASTENNTYYKMEMHYTMSPNAKETIDESGIRLIITKKKRRNIGGILAVGMHVSPFMIIPPGQSAFPVTGICDNLCVQKYFPKDGINVVGLRYHAHLIGIKHVIHRYSNGSELFPLADEHFDFDFQGFRFLKKEIKISSTESFVGECVYDSSKRNTTTISASPTKQEMCRLYFLYYPRLNLNWCISLLKPKDVFKLVGIQEIGPIPGSEDCKGSNCQSPLAIEGNADEIKITKPEKYANQTIKNFMMNFTDWTPERLKKLNELYHNQQQRICLVDNNPIYSKDDDTVDYPTKAKPYQVTQC